VDERTLFGCHAFMVDGKLCLAVKGEDLLVRLPPAEHAEATAETGTRELDPRGGMQGYFWVEPVGYATRAQWRVDRRSPGLQPAGQGHAPRVRQPARNHPNAAHAANPQRQSHSIFGDEKFQAFLASSAYP
jgi:hypothetical protein